MDIVVGKLGLEDLLIGTGQVTQALGPTKTRVVTRINAKNLPYDESRTLAQAIDSVLNLLESSEYDIVKQIADKIVLIADNINSINALNMDSINSISDSATIAAIDKVSKITDDIKSVVVLAEQAHKDAALSRRVKCDIDEALVVANAYAKSVRDAYTNQLQPLEEKLDNTLQLVYDKISSIKAELVEGQENADKLFNYELSLKCVPTCRRPTVKIDDANRKIVWTMPQPTYVGKLPDPPTSYVAQAVDEYLANLALFGNGGLGSVATQPDINEAIGIKELGPQFSEDNIDNAWIMTNNDSADVILFKNEALDIDYMSGNHRVYIKSANIINLENFSKIRLIVDIKNYDSGRVTMQLKKDNTLFYVAYIENNSFAVDNILVENASNQTLTDLADWYIQFEISVDAKLEFNYALVGVEND